ncbi:MAG: right-handed parallel beta-helix repeat-containing protein [bacterium]
MKKIIKCLIVWIVLGINITVYAADLYVPWSYTTIQTAVNAATTGDTIYVGTGTYNEAVYINKSIALVGAGANVCTITTTGLRYVNALTFDGAGGTITGFTIRKASQAGIYCINNANPTITNNTISENVEDGILCYNNSSPTITNNIILKNGNYGIHCKNNSFPTITNNIISGNRYEGIYCDYSSPFITNNIIIRNGYHGIYCNNSSPSIMNNIITENGTRTGSYGIYVRSGNPSVDYNCVWGNGSTNTNNYYNCFVGLYNISLDPQFIGNGDYHLSSNSLCIDVGSNTAPRIPEKDKDGNLRIVNDRVDIGVYEYQGTPTGLYSISGTVTDTNGNPISNALVKVISEILIKGPAKSPGRGEAITDNNGSFTISNLPFGTYTIRVSSVGYYQSYRNLLINGQISNMEFKMVSTQSLTIYVNKDNTSGTENGSLEFPYTSINRGVDSCFEGGTILVPSGIYNEAVYINKGISLIGEGANVCTITTTGLGYVNALTFDGAGGTITGFTIRKASQAGIYCINNANPVITDNTISENSWMGIRCNNSSPTITNNTISENSLGGVECNNSSPTITNNTISKNGQDGAIMCYNNSSPTITNNTISENWDDGIFCIGSSPTITNNTISENWGYGIKCSLNSSPTIINNTISKNWYRGGIMCDNSSPTITNNTISENWDCGISCYHSSPTITNNTISENKWEGIKCNNSSPTITNNIIVRTGTTSLNSYGIYVISGSPIIDYNDVWNNGIMGNQNYFNCSPGSNNISSDPEFISSLDFHLGSFSLCIDAGTNTAPGIQEKDKDGNPRIVNGIVDIGAYEYQGTFTGIISFTGSSTYSNETTLTETIEEGNLKLTNEDSSIVFNEFKRINIKTGGFSDKGFFKGTLTIDNNNCLFKGMSYQKGTVTFLNGVIEGYASGIMELVFEDSSYTGTFTLTQMGDEVAISTIPIKGSIESSEPDASNKTVTLEQKMIEGKITLTLTIVRIENEGFCVISYNSEEGTGEGYAYVKEKTLDGFLKNPIYGYILADLDKPPEVKIIRIDFFMPPMVDLNIKIWGPSSVSPGGTITYIVTIRNDGLKQGENIAVIASPPTFTDYVSASGTHTYFTIAHWEDIEHWQTSKVTHVPRIRWDFETIPPKSAITLNFQVKVKWGLPPHLKESPEVYIWPREEADEFYPTYDPEGDHD